VTPDTIQATVLKQGEEGGWIVRLFETSGADAGASIRLTPLGQSWDILLKGHQVKTFQVTAREAREVDLIEREG
jgi:hypothetical protein